MGNLTQGAIAALYITQGMTVYFLSLGLPTLLRSQGVGLESLGLLAALGLPAVFKFLWAPAVDRWSWPRLGQRRSWILPLQLVVVLVVLGIAQVDPLQDGLKPLLVMALLLVLITSTQDIAIDAFAIENLRVEQRWLGNALQAAGGAIGSIAGGTGLVWLISTYGWKPGMYALAAACTAGLLPIMLTKERHHHSDPPRVSLRAWRQATWRPEIKRSILFALVYRGSEGLVVALHGPLLIDAGLSVNSSAMVTGTFGAVAGIVSALSVSVLAKRWGAPRSIALIGTLRTAVYVGFALAFAAGLSSPFLAGLVLASVASRYAAFVPVASHYMLVSSRERAGTDFALLIGIDTVAYLVPAALGGVLAAKLGYPLHFTLAAVLSVLGTVYGSRLLRRATDDPDSQVARGNRDLAQATASASSAAM